MAVVRPPQPVGMYVAPCPLCLQGCVSAPAPAPKSTGEELLLQLDDVGVHVPENIPIYDLRDAAPQMWEPSSPQFEELLKYGRNNLADVMEQVVPDHSHSDTQPSIDFSLALIVYHKLLCLPARMLSSEQMLCRYGLRTPFLSSSPIVALNTGISASVQPCSGA